jgi:gliding motility-associated-like protein
MPTRKTILILITLLFITEGGLLYGQSAYVNTQSGIFQLTGGAGSCTRIAIDNGCGVDHNILSMAVYKDTLYYNTWGGELKRFKIGVSGSCETLIDGGFSYNAMTVDKNGIIYMANEELARYDPYTKELTNLGRMPFFSVGDLIFFKDKLLLAGYDPYDWSTGIFEINPVDLEASKLYMNTPEFIGLVSFPVSCGNNRYFGLSDNGVNTTQLTELDLANKRVISETGSIPDEILDAASSTETGLDAKVVITYLQVARSGQSATSSVQASAVYPEPGTITYTLDNNTTAANGFFPNVAPGQHRITATGPGGMCFADTLFMVQGVPENIPPVRNEVLIPNAFTPNNDGKNDLFTASFPSGFKNITLQIFNRNGNKVYEGRGNSISWDGTHKGIKQPVAVYVYSMIYTDQGGNQKNIKGTLTLIL